jgi:hypothetical protein
MIALFGGIGVLSAMGRTTEKGDSPAELFVLTFVTPICIAIAGGIAMLLTARKK